MRILYCAVILATALACASTRTQFLGSTDPTWNKWLDTVVDVSIKNVPIGELANRPPFQGMKVVLNDLDANSVVSLEAEKVTRRKALEKLAEQYNLSMTTVTTPGRSTTVVIGNREARALIKPLN